MKDSIIGAEKNAQLREEKLKITVDDVIALQKAKADYASSQNQSLKDQLENKNKLNQDHQEKNNAIRKRNIRIQKSEDHQKEEKRRIKENIMNKLVIVKWIDSGLCDSGWVEAKSYEKNLCQSVILQDGYIKRLKIKLFLYSSYSFREW